MPRVQDAIPSLDCRAWKGRSNPLLLSTLRFAPESRPDHKFKVYISGQRRRVTETIKRELRRRSAVEPVIGRAKAEHRMGRNYLAGSHGDAANAVLAAAGYNFRRLIEWLALLLSIILAALNAPSSQDCSLKPA